MKKFLRTMAIGLTVAAACAATAIWGYLQLPKFGALPQGERQARIERSPNYRDGEFRNLDPVPERTGNVLQGWFRMMTAAKDRPVPEFAVPSIKTDLSALDRNDDCVIWLGHASYFIQTGGTRFLVDPVFNTHAAPVPFANRAFAGTALYTPEEMPDIDCLIITHDHWDHLDYPTVAGLREKIGLIIMPLGVGAHFTRWKFPEEKICELDWGESTSPGAGITVHALPALHYSGRMLTRNKSLWAAYAVISPERKLYLGGDSGYGSHYKAAGETFGGFDFAVLDSGQYNEAWRWVHMMPEDTVLAANDLNAKAVMPVHTGKFSMAYHSWDDPFIRMVTASNGQPYELIMPVPGETVSLSDVKRYISGWWDRVDPVLPRSAHADRQADLRPAAP